MCEESLFSRSIYDRSPQYFGDEVCEPFLLLPVSVATHVSSRGVRYNIEHYKEAFSIVDIRFFELFGLVG